MNKNRSQKESLGARIQSRFEFYHEDDELKKKNDDEDVNIFVQCVCIFYFHLLQKCIVCV